MLVDKLLKPKSMLIVGFRGARFGDELSRLRMPPKSHPEGAHTVGTIPQAPSLFRFWLQFSPLINIDFAFVYSLRWVFNVLTFLFFP